MLTEKGEAEEGTDSISDVNEGIEDAEMDWCQAECIFDIGFVICEGHSAGVVHGVGAVRKDIHCIFHEIISMLYTIL